MKTEEGSKRQAWWSLIHTGEEFGAALCSPGLREGSCREQLVSCPLLERLLVSSSGFLGLLSRIHSLTLGCDHLQGPTSLLGPLLCGAVTLTQNQALGKGCHHILLRNWFTGRTSEPLSPSWSFLWEDSEAKGPRAFPSPGLLFSFSSFESEFGAHDTPESHPILAGQDLGAFPSRKKHGWKILLLHVVDRSLTAWKKLTPHLAASPTRKHKLAFFLSLCLPLLSFFWVLCLQSLF